MDNNELEYHKAIVQSKSLAELLRLFKHLLTCLAIIGCTYLIFDFFKACLNSPEPVLHAFAAVAEKFKLGSTFGLLWGGFATGAWALEHRGRKRAIALKGRYQNQIEHKDPNRTSSGLNHHGETYANDGFEGD